MSEGPKVEKRIARLRTELEEEAVPLLGADSLPPTLTSDAEQVESILLEELTYARHVPVHEGIRASYGCLILAEVDKLPAAVTTPVPPDSDLAKLRPLIDGERAVLVRDVAGNLALARLAVADELDLVRVAEELKAVAVQRLNDGRIRVRTHRHIVLNDNFDWSVRPQARTILTRVNKALNLPADIRKQTLDHLAQVLELCFHRLSPQGIGATLILTIVGTTESNGGSVSDQGVEPALAINVFDPEHHVLFENLLESVDGACQIEPDGTLVRYKTKLQVAPEVVSIISEQGGSRHTSSKRFSYEVREALVVVVSADGPVTLFADGAPVLKLQNQALRNYLTTYPVDRQEQVDDREDALMCDLCTRETLFEWAVDQSAGVERDLECAVCGALLRTEQNVIHLQSRIVKSWENA